MDKNEATYFIKTNYVPRLRPEYFVDVSSDRIVYQPDVYPIAGYLGQRLNCSYIVDIGCGTAQKLVDLYPQFQIIGIDYGVNIQFCRQKYTFGQWIDFNLETDAPIAIEIQILKRAIIICSDVIEHLVTPIHLLRNIKTLLEHAPVAILTTPERDLTRGFDDLGPPPNPCHVREWNLKELELLLRSERLNILFTGLTTSNNKECEKKTSLVIVGNNHSSHDGVLLEAIHTCPEDWFKGPAEWDASSSPRKAMVDQPSLSFPPVCTQFRIIAIITAYNEGDVIFHVIGDLIDNGVEVYLIDNNSTDNTIQEASKWLGKGLVHIEHFPKDTGYSERSAREYVWRDLLHRKEELAAQLGAAWYIHADADEFRESPWPNMTLSEAIRWVDTLGYNAINFELLNFRPTDDNFIPGTDVRKHLTYWEPGDSFDMLQIKAWKNTGQPVHLAQSGGHEVVFPGRKVFPLPFILRHYPIRGETHGRQKVFKERLPRFAAEERATGWHVQYNSFLSGESRFIRDPSTLTQYNPHSVRASLLSRVLNDVLLFSILHGPEWISSPLDGPATSAWVGRALSRSGPIPLPIVQQTDEALNTLLQLAAKSHWRCSTPVEATAVPLLKAVAKIKSALATIKGDHHIAKRLADLSEQINARRLVKGFDSYQASEVQFFKWTDITMQSSIVTKKNPKLVSIIILTHNQLEYTKRCLEGIFLHTDQPFELIIVDNASTDGVPEYLKDLIEGRVTVGGWRIRVGEDGGVVRSWFKNEKGKKKKKLQPKMTVCQRFKVIRNEKNLGYAAGNNQGMAEAKGDYFVLMNNDVVVTPGWLDRMIAVAERNPRIGIVGPMSNYVSGPQWIDKVSYDTTTLAGLNQFAQDYAERHKGQAKPFWRVVGFCMLIKRAVVEKIGGLDERYGLGNFEDDDFSLRARLAGFESWIAEDCFVHHFGSRTFAGSGIDYQESLKRNWEIFKKKWDIPSEIEYGDSFDLSKILSQGFDPVRHYYPLTPEAYSLSRGEELFQSGDVEGAKLIFNRLLQENPDEVDLLNNLGVIAYQDGEFDQAMTYFNRALKSNPDHLDVLENVGHCLVAKGAYREAVQYFEKALEQKPGDLSLLNSLGNCLIQSGDFLRAEDVYHRSYEIDETQMKVREILSGLEKLKSMETERRAVL